MIIDAVQKYLATRTVSPGETIQVGWLILRIASESKPTDLESLDFKSMGSFTKDLTLAESIYEMQEQTLRTHSREEESCSLMHTAVISKSYYPGHPGAFLKRDGIATNSDSGWYVGVRNDSIDFEDPSYFEIRSLYELSILDKRTLPYWLMPLQTLVYLDAGTVE